MSQNIYMSNLVGGTVRYTFKNGDVGEAIVLSQTEKSITVQTAQGGIFADNFLSFLYFSQKLNRYVKYSSKVTIDMI